MHFIAGAILTPDCRAFHPKYGDMTEDVCRELAAIQQADDAELCRTAAARQAALAEVNANGRLTPGFALKANIDPGVHDYWRRREGKDFWKHELPYMLKRHPELAVKSRPDNPTVRIDGFKPARPTRGGRWHTAA